MTWGRDWAKRPCMDENRPLPRWYAAKTRSGQDRVAVDNLTRQNFETYSPRLTIERMRNGRITLRSESLFPGYVLIKSTMDACAWRIINSTRGIVRLISFSQDGNPSALPIGEIELLKQREILGKLHVSEILRFRHGDQIRMKVGSSVDQIGEVVRTRGERVEFLMHLLGRRVRCIAPMHQLDLVGRRASD